MNRPWIFRTRKRAFSFGLFLVYATTMLFGGCASSLILFPSRQPIDAKTARQVFVPVGDKKVEVFVDRSPTVGAGEPQAFSVEFTGNATRAEQVATDSAGRWGSRSVEVWMVNYPGYGASEGKADLGTIAPAALAVYDHVAQLANGRPIYTGGNSLGTVAALYVAAQRPAVTGLVLQNPPAIRSLILGKFGWWNLWLLAGPVALQVPKELDSPTNAAKVNAPAIFLLATDDTFVAPWNQQKVVDAYAGPKKVINMTGGHNDGVPADAYKQLDADLDWLVAQRR